MGLTVKHVTFDCRSPQELGAFWGRVLGTEIAVDYGDYVLLPADPAGVAFFGFQRVGSPTPGKNRIHLDFVAEAPGPEVERLVGLGATKVAAHSLEDLEWTIMADPEGNQFCVANQ